MLDERMPPAWADEAGAPRGPRWVRVCRLEDVRPEEGVCALVDGVQVALFRLPPGERWYAIENRCPHWGEMVLSRGLVGESGGEPRVACPMHKRLFSLDTGRCLSEGGEGVRTFEVAVERGAVFVRRPETRSG